MCALDVLASETLRNETIDTLHQQSFPRELQPQGDARHPRVRVHGDAHGGDGAHPGTISVVLDTHGVAWCGRAQASKRASKGYDQPNP